MDRDDEFLERYANFTWQSRWNQSYGPVAAGSWEVDGNFWLHTCMGLVRLSKEDLPHFRKQMKAALKIVKEEMKIHGIEAGSGDRTDQRDPTHPG